MAEPESVSGRLVLVFDHVPGGIGSEYLCSLRVGDEIVLSGPYGSFIAPSPVTVELLLIARFTGIVPIRCILTRLFAGPVMPNSVPPQATLIYGIPNGEEQIYDDEFRALAASGGGFRYLPTILNGQTRRSEIDILRSGWEGRRDFYPMVCGVKEFVRPFKAYFLERGLGRKEMKFETYD